MLAMYKGVKSPKVCARNSSGLQVQLILCQHLGVHIDIRLEREKGGVGLEGFPHLE